MAANKPTSAARQAMIGDITPHHPARPANPPPNPEPIPTVGFP